MKHLKRINDELEGIEKSRTEMYFNGEEYAPSGSVEINYHVDCEPVGNPFAPLPYARASGMSRFRSEILEPKNI